MKFTGNCLRRLLTCWKACWGSSLNLWESYMEGDRPRRELFCFTGKQAGTPMESVSFPQATMEPLAGSAQDGDCTEETWVSALVDGCQHIAGEKGREDMLDKRANPNEYGKKPTIPNTSCQLLPWHYLMRFIVLSQSRINDGMEMRCNKLISDTAPCFFFFWRLYAYIFLVYMKTLWFSWELAWNVIWISIQMTTIVLSPLYLSKCLSFQFGEISALLEKHFLLVPRWH